MEQNLKQKTTAKEPKYRVWDFQDKQEFVVPLPENKPTRLEIIRAAGIFIRDKQNDLGRIKNAINELGVKDSDPIAKKLKAIDDLTHGLILSGLDDLAKRKKEVALEEYRVSSNNRLGSTAVRNLVQDLGVSDRPMGEKIEALQSLRRDTIIDCVDIAAACKVMSTTSEYHVFNGQRNGLLAELYNLCNAADSDGWAGEGSKGIPEGIGLRAAEWLSNLEVAERGYLPNEIVVEAGSGCIIFRWRNLKKKVELTFGAEIDCVYYKGNIPQDVIQNLVPPSDRVSDSIKSKINMMWSG